jgi:type II secretory pathway component PulF
MVLTFVLLPITPALFWALSVFVFPKFEQIFADLLEGRALPPMPWVMSSSRLAEIELAVAAVFYVGAVLYVGGPRFIAWLQAGLSTVPLDWVIYQVPWRAKRIHRDFGAMLAVLLDAGVPEATALKLAGESTANRYFQRRVEMMIEKMERGTPLPTALEELDRSSELQWRLSAALKAGRGFFAALGGWLEALDAKAFRQEHTVAQLVTTGLVILNGFIIASFTIYVFAAIQTVLEDAVLW